MSFHALTSMEKREYCFCTFCSYPSRDLKRMPPSIQRRSWTKIQQRFRPPSLLATEKCIHARAHKKSKVRRPGKERKEFKGVFPFVATRMCTGDAVSFLAPEVWRRGKIKERRGFLTLKGGGEKFPVPVAVHLANGEGFNKRNATFSKKASK